MSILKRLAFVLFFPVYIVGIPVSIVLSPVVWLLTGIEPLEVMDWWVNTSYAIHEWTTR